MIMVAGIAASVIIQTMNSLQQQALTTGSETIKEVSSGVKVTQVTGYHSGSKITQLAIFLRTVAGSADVDLNYAYVTLSDTSKQVVLNCTTTTGCFSGSVSNGLFGTLNSSNLSATTFGLMVVRDYDSSCLQTAPTINSDDLVVLLVNATECFSGIDTRTDVIGNVVPGYGTNGVISFTTPSAFIDTIIELQT